MVLIYIYGVDSALCFIHTLGLISERVVQVRARVAKRHSSIHSLAMLTMGCLKQATRALAYELASFGMTLSEHTNTFPKILTSLAQVVRDSITLFDL